MSPAPRRFRPHDSCRPHAPSVSGRALPVTLRRGRSAVSVMVGGRFGRPEVEEDCGAVRRPDARRPLPAACRQSSCPYILAAPRHDVSSTGPEPRRRRNADDRSSVEPGKPSEPVRVLAQAVGEPAVTHRPMSPKPSEGRWKAAVSMRWPRKRRLIGLSLKRSATIPTVPHAVDFVDGDDVLLAREDSASGVASVMVTPNRRRRRAPASNQLRSSTATGRPAPGSPSPAADAS